MAKLMFSQKQEQIRSVASDGLIKYLEATVSLNIKNPVQISRKTGFKVEIEDQNQSKEITIATINIIT